MLLANQSSQKPPKVLLIAASDQIGCSGIDRDAATLQALNVHPMRLLTGLTLQDNCGFLQTEAVSEQWFRQQLDFYSQIDFQAIKIGALLTQAQFSLLADWIATLKALKTTLPIIWDPVMFTSGGRCLCDSKLFSMLNSGENLAPGLKKFLESVDMVTPNLDEAKRLLGCSADDKIMSLQQIIKWKRYHQLSHLGWLQKGGHLESDIEQVARGREHLIDAHENSTNDENDTDKVTDYFVRQDEIVVLQSRRQIRAYQRGTGCTLASAVAAFLALGADTGDALVLAKWCLNESLDNGYEVIQGQGPVLVQGFPKNILHFPNVRYLSPGQQQVTATELSVSDTRPAISFTPVSITPVSITPVSITPVAKPIATRHCASVLGSEPSTLVFRELELSDLGVYPIVASTREIMQLIDTGIRLIQLRLKSTDTVYLKDEIQAAVELTAGKGLQLYINDHWQLAVDAGAFGVHLGQTDLTGEALQEISQRQMALGISTHNYFEIARSLTLNPSYLAFGPVFPTISKQMPWQAQGIERLKIAAKLAECPVVAIGGIQLDNIARVARSGVMAAAMISALSGPDAKAQCEELSARWHNALN